MCYSERGASFVSNFVAEETPLEVLRRRVGVDCVLQQLAAAEGSCTERYNGCTMREGYEPIGDPLYDNPEHWKPGTFGHHELLDRVRLVADLWWKKVEEHPTARHDTELSRRTDEIGSLMEDLYQYVGGLDIREDAPPHIREARPSWGT